jgi:serine/threonine protein kinase
MAPEVALRKPYTEKVDVYSFGMILWQLTSGKIPFVGMKRAEFERDVVRGGYRPPIRKDLPAELVDLIERCWSYEASNRPSSGQVVEVLEKIRDDLFRRRRMFHFPLFRSSRSSRRVMDESAVEQHLRSRLKKQLSQ